MKWQSPPNPVNRMGGQPAIAPLSSWHRLGNRAFAHTVERIGQLPMMDKMGDVEYLVRQAISSAAAAGNQKRATRAES